MFSCCCDFPGIYHITDVMGVSFTLITGKEKAILFDTGYGIENVRSYIETLTNKPCYVLLSHGHHDHILGARWFECSHMFAEDQNEFFLRTAAKQRLEVRRQATEKGIPVPEGFLTAPVTLPQPIKTEKTQGAFDWFGADLGDMLVDIFRIPGHTPGSAVIYIPKYRLMLTGDNWNPCSWIWFPSAVPVQTWRENMLSLIKLLEKRNDGIEHVYCAHQPMLRSGSELIGFFAYMTDERLEAATAIDMKSSVRTYAVTKQETGWMLVYDREKFENTKRMFKY